MQKKDDVKKYLNDKKQIFNQSKRKMIREVEDQKLYFT